MVRVKVKQKDILKKNPPKICVHIPLYIFSIIKFLNMQTFIFGSVK